MALFTTLNGILGGGATRPTWFLGADGTDGKFSSDNGTTWTDITSTTIDRSSYYGLQTGVVMASGFGPAGVYRSVDNGANFTNVSNPTGVQINSFTADNSGNWNLTGTSGTFAQSTNDGLTWSSITSPFTSSSPRMASITNDGAGNFVAVGDNHNPGAGQVSAIASSSDSGATWTDRSIDTSGNELEDISTDGTTWIAVGTKSSIFKSTDSGVNWTAITSDPFGGLSGDNIHSICNFNGTWLIVGVDSTVSGSKVALSRSTDSGATWSSFISNASTEGGGSARVRVGRDGVFMITHGQSGGARSSISVDTGSTWATEVNTGITGSLSTFITFLGNNSGNT